MRRQGRTAEAGFSMLELTVAVLITLIISSAVYGLLVSSQGMFRREPALTDRQQNIRIAMTMMTQDAVNGINFMVGNGLGGSTGNGNVVGNIAATDKLQTYVESLRCPDIELAKDTGSNINTKGGAPIPSCYPEPGIVLVFFADGTVKPGWGHNIHAGDSKLNFPDGQGPQNPPPGMNATLDINGPGNASRLGMGDIVIWQIGVDTDGVPALYRTSTGGVDPNPPNADNPGICVNPAPTGCTAGEFERAWRVVARGIEDLQVQYRTQANYNPGNATVGWTDDPTTTGNPTNDLVRELEISLRSRTVHEARLEGESTIENVGGVRGELRQVITPRPTLSKLAAATPALYN